MTYPYSRRPLHVCASCQGTLAQRMDFTKVLPSRARLSVFSILSVPYLSLFFAALNTFTCANVISASVLRMSTVFVNTGSDTAIKYRVDCHYEFSVNFVHSFHSQVMSANTCVLVFSTMINSGNNETKACNKIPTGSSSDVVIGRAYHAIMPSDTSEPASL